MGRVHHKKWDLSQHVADFLFIIYSRNHQSCSNGEIVFNDLAHMKPRDMISLVNLPLFSQTKLADILTAVVCFGAAKS